MQPPAHALGKSLFAAVFSNPSIRAEAPALPRLPQALNQLTQKTISATAASLLKDMGDVQSVSDSLQDALKGLQGTAGEQAKASMDKISAASAALNDVAGKLTGEGLGRAGTGQHGSVHHCQLEHDWLDLKVRAEQLATNCFSHGCRCEHLLVLELRDGGLLSHLDVWRPRACRGLAWPAGLSTHACMGSCAACACTAVQPA
jgi:hypothetical protein